MAQGDSLLNAGTLTIAGSLAIDGAATNLGSIAGDVGLVGGVLTNGSKGVVSGDGTVVLGTASADSVTNEGTIVATGSAAIGIDLSAGGRIVNGGTAAKTALIAGSVGVQMAGGTLISYGTIDGTGGTAVNNASVVEMASSAVFDGVVDGATLALIGATGAGTLAGLGSTFMVDAVEILAGADWTLLAAGASFTPGTSLVNDGTVTVEGTLSLGGALDNLGSVLGGLALADVNGSGALLNGSHDEITGTGIALLAGGVAVTNQGVILATGPGSVGVESAASDQIVTNEKGGRIVGDIGVELTGPGTLSNAGVILGRSGTAALLSAGDTLVVDPGAIFQGVVIGNDAALVLGAGTGALSGIETAFAGFAGIDVEGRWTLDGTNTIAQPLYIDFRDRLTNAGTLSMTGTLAGGGSLVNAGVIEAAVAGGVGIDLTTRVTPLDNLAGGLIEGGTGVSISDGTLINAGTVDGTSGTAVLFTGGGVLKILPGAVFDGAVVGDGLDELVLGAGTGTLDNIGAVFSGFDRLSVAGNWLLTGTDSFAAGLVVSSGATLTNAGELTLDDVVQGPGVLDNQAGANLTIFQANGRNMTLDNAGFVSFASGNPSFFCDNTGTIDISSGGLEDSSNAGVIEAGGREVHFWQTLTNTGTLAVTGDVWVSDVLGAGTVAISGSGGLGVGGAVARDQTVVLTGSGGELTLQDVTQFAAGIHGFAAKDALDLENLASGSTARFVVSGTYTTVEITDGAAKASIELFGQYVASGFAVTAEGSTGLRITYTPPPASPVHLAAGS